MQELPFNIPKSLSSFVEKFDEDPEKATLKLQNHLKKRGPDAVGHFLLSWFYHLQNKNNEAIKEALKAKTYAPGSPLMEHLHYYLVHPEKFKAAIPDHSYTSSTIKLQQGSRTSPVLDLDRLIEMLEQVESKRIKIPEDDEPFDESDLSKEAENVDDVVSETLAKIHSKQGRKKEAVKMYERLMDKNSDKADHYQKMIDKLKKT
ncbi:MAG: tetratricopeptide repeat-containing protein [Gracilimonas sp.]|uniref:tetratricopeptide repeat protein n=1 Tax=Gracilimonas sp. TaxID=1974203 RepID=UPI00199645A8|nr:tetratricopeptide repeat protein [Gracilimonas sp.]MBD3616370.1 tetratricopeptide repeat-containing protein [Gracilimonas sp.]